MNDADRRQTSDGFDNDAMFADIVAHWNDPAAEPTPIPRPSSGDADGNELTGGESSGSEVGDERAAHEQVVDEQVVDEQVVDEQVVDEQVVDDRTAAIPAPQAWRAHEVDPEYEEHFEPPPIAPLPVGDLQFWAIIAGMCGGPLLLLYLVLFSRDAGSGWMLTAIAMSVGGFALLISRLPRDHEDDDDGARL